MIDVFLFQVYCIHNALSSARVPQIMHKKTSDTNTKILHHNFDLDGLYLTMYILIDNMIIINYIKPNFEYLLSMTTFDFSIIKTLRMKWGLTAEELATRAGVTRATVAKIESGNGNPTMETIGALSRVFQTPASELIRMAEVSLCERGETTPFTDDQLEGVHVSFPNFEIYHLKAGAGVHKVSEPGRHENTAEVCFVMSGKIRLTVHGESHVLGPDMALRFKALHEHHIDIVENARFLLIHHNQP
jgi:XRE family transcriptional regulator, regulator of sulfur utilization